MDWWILPCRKQQEEERLREQDRLQPLRDVEQERKNLVDEDNQNWASHSNDWPNGIQHNDTAQEVGNFEIMVRYNDTCCSSVVYLVLLDLMNVLNSIWIEVMKMTRNASAEVGN